MNAVRIAWRAFFVLVILMCTPWPAFAEDLDRPLLVVATPELEGFYMATVILATPRRGGHVGVILNRPTGVTMAEIFPDHEPSKKVTATVCLGGPERLDSLYALIAGASPHPSSIEMAPGVWLVANSRAIDNIVEATPNAARYFAGFVGWKPGELAEELRQGMFVVRPVDPKELFELDPSTMWNKLRPPPREAGVVGT